MSSILEMLTQQMSGQTVAQMSQQVGADPASTQKAVMAALPALLGGLARNANKSPEQARSLAHALERDHDGSVLESLSSLISGGGGGGLLGQLAGGMLGGGRQPQPTRNKALDGDGILGHVLGNKRGAVEQGVARASGLDTAKAAKLMALLAPVVMGALGKAKRQQNLDADGIAALLNRERAEVERRAPGMQQGGLLGMLDMDNDGDVADDVAKIGGMLGKLFGN